MLSIPLLYAVVIATAAGASLDQEINLVSLGMIGSACGGLLQNKRRGPVGSGFLVIPGLSSVHMAGSLVALRLGGMPMVWGLIISIGLLQSVASRFLRVLRFLLPAELAGLSVLLTGVTLGRFGIPDIIGGVPSDPLFHQRIVLGCVTLAAMVACSVWGARLRLFSAAIGIIGGYAASLALGTAGSDMTQRLAGAPWFRVPRFGVTGLAFSPSLMLPLLVGGAAATLSTIACVTAVQKMNDADWRRQDLPSLAGGVLADGLGAILAALLGGVGQSASPAGVGLSASIQATSRTIAYAVALGFLLLSLFPKFAMLVVLMPQPVIGAALVFNSCALIINGIEIIASRLLDARKTFTLGLAFAAAVASPSIAAAAHGMPEWLVPITESPLFLGVAVALVLNPLLRIGIAQRERLTISADTQAHEVIERFVNECGAHWGARRDVIERAGHVLAEVIDAIRHGDLADGDITLELGFNELRLRIRIAYVGPPLVITQVRPTREEIIAADGAMRLAGFLVARLASNATSQAIGNLAELRITIDH